MRTKVVHPGLSLEYVLWIFTRVSGVSLVIMGIIGLLSALVINLQTQAGLPALFRWAILPNPNHVAPSAAAAAGPVWSSAFWQIVQILIVFFAATHGFNGLRAVLEDFAGPSAWRPLLFGFLFLLWVTVLIMAVFVILST